MGKKKSDFYHIRWNRVGLNEERAAKVLGVSLEDVKRWDLEGAPEMAKRLLLLWDCKNVGFEGWEGFLFSRGVLRFKNRRWTPQGLKSIYQDQDTIANLEKELRELRSWRGLITFFVDKVVSSFSPHQRHKGPPLN